MAEVGVIGFYHRDLYAGIQESELLKAISLDHEKRKMTKISWSVLQNHRKLFTFLRLCLLSQNC